MSRYDWQQNIKAVTSFQYKHIRICYLKEEAKSKTYYPHHEGSVPLSSGGRPLLGLYQAIRCLHRGLPPLPRHPPPRQLPGHPLQVQAHRVSRPGRVRQAINVCIILQIFSFTPLTLLTSRTVPPAPTGSTSARAWRTTSSASVSGQGAAPDARAMWRIRRSVSRWVETTTILFLFTLNISIYILDKIKLLLTIRW